MTRPTRFHSLTLLISMLALVRASGAGAAVAVMPPDTTVVVGTTFSVQVVTDAVPDLKGAELIFSYDPTLLAFDGATAGDVFTGSGRAYASYVVPDVAPADSIWYDAAMLDGTTAGPGIIVFFTFHALQVGDAEIQCERVDIRDSLNQSTLPVCAGGMVHITGPTPVRRTTWSSLKTIYR